ncbi:DUF4232 domain-containing protein [Actinacidiphila yeochonensis]|uniref:DUF4232 domain-containing protein n=1 Tax=Actinacidiphila yeochonensis TaxID=89050 RepID=UPI00068E1241|nr:DUF4232 domain-containing protein [Actinacidiphila yeochonensis]
MYKGSWAAGAAAVVVAALGAAPAVAGTPVADASATPMCATSQLSVSLGGSDAGAGQLYHTLVFTNTGSTTCHLTGYPGVSLLDASGRQIGQPADRDPRTYSPVVLAPGAAASDTIHTANRIGSCLPDSVKVKVYPPGNTASTTVSGAVAICSGTFTVTPLAAGDDGNPPGNSGPSASPTAAPTASATVTGGTGTAGGAQISAVPSGAPDTGLAATGSGGSDTGLYAAAGAGVLLLGGAGLAVARRRGARAGR